MRGGFSDSEYSCSCHEYGKACSCDDFDVLTDVFYDFAMKITIRVKNKFNQFYHNLCQN